MTFPFHYDDEEGEEERRKKRRRRRKRRYKIFTIMVRFLSSGKELQYLPLSVDWSVGWSVVCLWKKISK